MKTTLLTFVILLSFTFSACHAALSNISEMFGGIGLQGVDVPGVSGSEQSNKDDCTSQESLVCHFQKTKYYKVKGYVTYEPKWQSGKCYVQVKANIEGLEKNQEHKLHIHSYGDLSANDGSDTGGHWYGPGPSDDKSEEERLRWYNRGLLKADNKGNAKMSYVDKHITLDGIVGRGMIIHGGKDPSQRVAQCVIGYKNASP